MAHPAAHGMSPTPSVSRAPNGKRSGHPCPPLKTPPYDRFGRFMALAMEEKSESKGPDKAEKPTGDPLFGPAQVLAGQIMSELTAAAAAHDAGQAGEYFSSRATAGRVAEFARQMADQMPDGMGEKLLTQLSPMVEQAVQLTAKAAKNGKAPSRAMLKEAAQYIASGQAEGNLGPGVVRGLQTVFKKGVPAAHPGGVLLLKI